MQYLFHKESYDKPLFTVYFKTSLFTIYLLPFFFWRPWQRLCTCPLWSNQKKKVSLSIQQEHDKRIVPQRNGRVRMIRWCQVDFGWFLLNRMQWLRQRRRKRRREMSIETWSAGDAERKSVVVWSLQQACHEETASVPLAVQSTAAQL